VKTHMSQPPPSAHLRRLRKIFLVAQPPRLKEAGLCTTGRGRYTKSTNQNTKSTRTGFRRLIFVPFVSFLVLLVVLPSSIVQGQEAGNSQQVFYQPPFKLTHHPNLHELN
jgi:hypothetical protein